LKPYGKAVTGSGITVRGGISMHTVCLLKNNAKRRKKTLVFFHQLETKKAVRNKTIQHT